MSKRAWITLAVFIVSVAVVVLLRQQIDLPFWYLIIPGLLFVIFLWFFIGDNNV
jgi:hypothetical protein